MHPSCLVHQRPRRVVAGAISLSVFVFIMILAHRKHAYDSIQNYGLPTLVEELPQGDKPDRSEGPETVPPSADRPAVGAPSEKSAWDKSLFLNGPPTRHFRDNLKPDLKYITTWNYGGMTNDVMVWMNMIHLGVLSNRIPILSPLAGGEDHVGPGPETLSAGTIFDFPRLSQVIQHPVLDWQDVKMGRFNQPWDRMDHTMHGDDEMLGCWSIFQTLNDAKMPLEREMPHFLHLDVHYTGVPPWVELNNTVGGHASSKALSHLISPAGRSEALSAQPPLPTYSKRPLPPTTPYLEPDDQLACFDNLYWVWSEQVWEWGTNPSPTWDFVGTHLHFRKEVDRIATRYLQRVFGLKEDDNVPPFVSIHARHGDFKNLCQNSEELKSCYAPLSEYSRHVRDVAAELARTNGPDSPLANVEEVIVTSDEVDPEWWDEVERMGWRHMRSIESEIAGNYGKRYPGIIDSVVQARGAAFVGTSQSTMSIIAARRVISWNKGPIRLVEWAHR